MKLSKELDIDFLDEKDKENKVRTAGELNKMLKRGVKPDRIFSDMSMHPKPKRKKTEKSVFEELEVREI